jgi:hypothetical protein
MSAWELGHDELQLDDIFSLCTNSASETTPNTASSYMDGCAEPGRLLDLDKDLTLSPDANSWTDYVLGTGLKTDCSTPSFCEKSGRIDAARSGDEMELDTEAAGNNPGSKHAESHEWNWPLVPNLIPGAASTRDGGTKQIPKRRTMILQHMRPDQISRVMDLLLTWNSPVDVKIVNQD